MSRSFSVTWDYRCPFARNAHEQLLAGLAAGADWDVRFLAFSLGQAHVPEGEASVWDEPDKDTGLLALQAGVWVRDHDRDRFPDVHRALFAARHDEGLKIKERDVVRAVLDRHGVDADEVFSAIDDGSTLKTIQTEHEAFVESHNVFGVPTFITGDEAVFVRVMDRSTDGDDPDASIRTIDRIVDLLDGWPELNEFKHTSIKR
jgi:hypothetical protein